MRNSDIAELFRGGFVSVEDFLGQNLEIRETVGVAAAFISEPETTESDLARSRNS